MTQDKYITDAQKLLLQAATQPGEAAIAAWETWKTIVDLDESDAASYQLLPLVYRNLSNYDYQDDLMPKLKGIYRLRWCKNQVILQLCVKIIHVLQQSGIKAIILKDIALLSQYYPDLGQRNINNLALLVAPQQVLKALAILNGLGWQESDKITPKILQIQSCINFYGQPDFRLELHWYLTGIPITTTFSNVKFIQLQHISTSVLNSEAQLIQLCLQKNLCDSAIADLSVCVATPQEYQVSRILWITDILMILNQGLKIDFDLIIFIASKYRLIANLQDKLPLLAEIINLVKFPIYLKTFPKLPNPRNEVFEDHIIKHQKTAWQIFLVRYNEYLRIASHRGENFNIFGFIKYLQVIWELEYVWQVPLKVIKWAIKNKIIAV